MMEHLGHYSKMLQNEPIIIAIDGYSSCGKSTLSRDLARTLSYRYIDTGAMYRAVALYALQQGINPIEDPQLVPSLIDDIHIDFRVVDGQNTTFLNGENVERDIRTVEVASVVSQVAELTEVRRFLVAQQQAMGHDKAIVMDGRDIGTVVFPQAELKIFMTADVEIRAQRRLTELTHKGYNYTMEDIMKNLQERDHIDSTRSDSPLVRAQDAYLLDTSHLTRDQQLAKAIQWAIESKK